MAANAEMYPELTRRAEAAVDREAGQHVPSRGIRSKPLTSARKYTDASNHRPGKLIADVIGVALVEIGLRNARGYLLSRPIHDIAESGHAEDYDTSRANDTNA